MKLRKKTKINIFFIYFTTIVLSDVLAPVLLLAVAPVADVPVPRLVELGHLLAHGDVGVQAVSPRHRAVGVKKIFAAPKVQVHALQRPGDLLLLVCLGSKVQVHALQRACARRSRKMNTNSICRRSRKLMY